MITDTELSNRFNYHAPDDYKRRKHEEVRSVLLFAAKELVKNTPDGREQSTMLTKLEEAMFWANASIARRD